jgi:hypothetical protein
MLNIKQQAAEAVAKVLGYSIKEGETAAEIAINALTEQSELARQLYNDSAEFRQILSLSEEIGVEYSDELVASIVEAKQAVSDTDSEEEDEEPSDEELDAMIAHINDWDDVVDAYDPEEISIVDQETGEEVDQALEESQELNEVLSRAERIKARMRFARTAGKRQRKLQVALKRRSNSATINKRARHLAVKTMETKLAKGKPLNTLSVPERERIERIIQKRKAVIGRLALKLTSRVKKIEADRLSHKTFTK